MLDHPRGFLLTWRTFGTWLHGDERGSVDSAHNIPGTPLLPPDAQRAARERTRMRRPPLVLDARMRECADAAIRAECAFRSWELVQAAVRTNHVHAVVLYASVAPEVMIGRLKSHATRVLRLQKLVSVGQPVWAAGVGSRRYLWTDTHLRDAEAYVREGQDVPR